MIAQEDYEFTTDWAQSFIRNATEHLMCFKGTPISYLEIGVFEGRSACWMLDNILTHSDARYTGVDITIQDRACRNLQKHKDKITLIDGDSKTVIPRLSEKFDIIYIDGDHSAKGAMFDSVAAWQCSKSIIIWDDFKNNSSGNRVLKAVMSFLTCIPRREYKILFCNEQFGIIKR